MKTFYAITLLIAAARTATLTPKINEEEMVKGLPVFKFKLDRDENVPMITLSKRMKYEGKLIQLK